ncbi:MAG: hypothetical protein ACYC3I_22905 [Gemmataceae bacterium]
MVDGIWFPCKAVYRNYYHNKNIHQLAREDRFEIERITFRADEIPDSQFEIPVTGETELIDRDRNNLRIVGPDKVDKHILEAVADVERERTGGGWRPWVYASASVLLLLGAVYLGIRIVLRTRAQNLASPQRKQGMPLLALRAGKRGFCPLVLTRILNNMAVFTTIAGTFYKARLVSREPEASACSPPARAETKLIFTTSF